MTDVILDPDHNEPSTALRQADSGALRVWLKAPPSPNPGDDLAPLSAHLSSLRLSQTPPQQRAMLLGQLYCRSIATLNALRPGFADISLPLPHNIRVTTSRLQKLLRSLAEDMLATPNIMDGHLIRGLREQQATLLHSSVYALSQHLLISNLIASPVETGIWPLLHKTYATARRLKVANITPEGSSSTLQDVYHSALLLGCAQPASLTSRELEFLASFLEQFADHIELLHGILTELSAAFWIDPAADVAAFPCARKAVPRGDAIDYFSCAKVARLLKGQLEALESGHAPQGLKLPDFAGTPAGRGVLRRLIAYWSDPGKRRFPRRHQNHRALLCAGLDNLWCLLQNRENAESETSSWMITNESPEGYAVMHVSGKPGRLSVGEVTAIRTETETDWKICIVRLSLSENQVHFELGLQILATNAVPAFLARSGESNAASGLSVLILPKIPAIGGSEMMVVPSGALENRDSNHVLVIEQDNITIREVRSTHVNEQNSQIEVFSITPDASPDDESLYSPQSLKPE